MSGSEALDVAFGLALVFLLFSLAASRINETIASVLGILWGARSMPGLCELQRCVTGQR
jgi:hypothetical protein